MDELLKGCEAAALLPTVPYGMVINHARWDDIMSNVPLVKPSREGLMEFHGFKVKVDDRVPDYLIVWTDAKGVVLHITDLRKDDDK